MNKLKFDKVLNDYTKLYGEGDALSESLSENFDNFVDFHLIGCTLEKHRALLYRLSVYLKLNGLIFKVESDKDRFEVQKAAKALSNETKEHIKELVEYGRTMDFDDYRCKDFMRRWVDFLLEAETLFE